MFSMMANWELSYLKSFVDMLALTISTTRRQTADMFSVWSSLTSNTSWLVSLCGIFRSVWCHNMVWHPIEPYHVVVCIGPMYRSWQPTILLWYQVTLEIIQCRTKISTVDAGSNEFIGRSENNLIVAKLANHSLGKIRIHKIWPTCHPFRVQGNDVKLMRLAMTLVLAEANFIWYMTIKIHS